MKTLRDVSSWKDRRSTDLLKDAEGIVKTVVLGNGFI